MKKVKKSKRWFYTLCFIAMNGIDFVRNTQNGDIFSIAANATGLVLMLIVASGYSLKEIHSPFTYIWSISCAGAIVMIIAHESNHIWGVYRWALVIAVLNVWWIGIYGKLLLQKIFVQKSLRVRLNATAWLWIAMTVFMTFSVSGMIWPLWFFLMFGLFYLTGYEERDVNDMLEGMIDGTVISFFVLQIYAYGFRPYDELRYIGAFSNCNITALHYMLVYAMVLFRLHLLEQKKAKKVWKLFYFLGAAGLLCFLLLTMGRTAWVGAILITLMFGIFAIRMMWQKTWGKVFARGLALAVAAMLMFPLVFGTVRWLPTILHHPVWYVGEYSINKVHSFDPADSWKYTDMDEFWERVLGRIKGTFQVKNPFVLKVYAAENSREIEVVPLIGPENMDLGLRSRLAIYKAYFEDLTWIGNPPTAGFYQLEGYTYHSWHAQNVWLQVAYSFGVPAGILFVVMTFILLWHHFKGMIKNKNWPYAMIPLFICVAFFTYGIMEVVWNVGQLVLFLFFFVQHPAFSKVQYKEEEPSCS